MKNILVILLFVTALLSANNEVSEQEMNQTFDKYKTIITNIKDGNTTKYTPSIDISKLIVRMGINQEKGYDLAYKRDLLLLSLEKDKEIYSNTLQKLSKYVKLLKNKEEFIRVIDEALNAISDFHFKPVEFDGIVAKQYNTVLKQYIRNRLNILNSLNYLRNNIDDLTQHTKLLDFSILDLVDYIDTNIVSMKANIISKKITGVTLGQIIISLSSLVFFILLKWVFAPMFIRFIDSSIKDESINNARDVLKDYLKFPLNLAVLVLSLDIIFEVLHIQAQTFVSISYWLVVLLFANNIINSLIDLYSHKLLEKYPDTRKEVVLFFKRAFLLVSILVFASITLSKLGVELTALLGGVGVIGLGLSLAFKDTFSNFVGSVNIILEKTFSVGDWIEVNGVEGTVIEIGIRQTRLRGFANNEYDIPNAILANSIINNWSKRKIGRRIKFKVGITYETPKEKIVAIKNDIKKMLENNEGISNRLLKFEHKKRNSALVRKEDDLGVKTTLLVYIDELNDYSIDILVYAFTKTVIWEEWLSIKEDVIVKIMEIVEKHNAEFAYPTKVVQLKNIDKDNE